ncbi:Dabb family protein [Aliifodinibius sp. S!AR15-10]|uniref:Dabb family protein n=1 Tax=Aliifodinibius sp. S!AR15-10 TaxID=2950437 RepID=UPI002865ECF4|nr:Dabb family protein [Aliifodinibius sp. S!AR15-10]MDR8394560.1 Dabb family protein [Aliifodinibius sp. S!AR15-10]
MKASIFLTTIIALLLSYSPLSFDGIISETESETVNKEKTMNEELLRHVVMIKFKENTTEQEITKVEEAFSALPDKIDAISDYEWGTNNSPEGLNKGFTHCFLVTFESEEDRATYLPHPDHKAFVSVLEPHLEDVMVLDYWASED